MFDSWWSNKISMRKKWWHCRGQCKETRRNNFLILKKGTKQLDWKTNQIYSEQIKTHISRWNCTILEIILCIQQLTWKRILQCYPQPSQGEKNLNKNVMARKISIKFKRKMKAVSDRQELKKFTTHTLFMNKRNYSRRYSNKMKKRKRSQERGWPTVYTQVWPKRREESLKALKRKSTKMKC